MYRYPEDILDNLDFDRIIEALTTFCKGQIARDRCHNMKFFAHKERIERMLDEVSEVQQAIIQEASIPIAQYEDISADLFLLKKENYVLEVEALTRIINQVRMIHELVQYAGAKGFDEDYPHLTAIIGQVDYDPKIISRFDKIFDQDNSIKKDASPELAQIFKRIQRKERELIKQFEAMSTTYTKLGYLTDNKESYRNGRRVFSVTAENKRKINGVIHDESSSGKTVFIEPQELTILNNDLHDLESEKRQEVYRILRELCNQLRPFVADFELWQKVIVRLDFIQAKSKLAILMEGNRPKINTDGIYHFKQAYNPYLLLVNQQSEKLTIPFSMELDRDTRILVISGPNAGGKSVTMKGVGLILFMVQCGLLPPLDPDSNISLPSKILADIGDQQSIEDDLSTYSSRLKNMKIFLEKADKKSFILIDEFGSGTDPKVGGALAEAILDRLHQKNAQGVITTHYSNIKLYSYERKGMSNAAMVFDQKKLAPTYRLQQGKPGSSFAFEIADKIGLPKDIVKYAKNKSGEHTEAIDTLLSDLQSDKKSLRDQLTIAEKEKRELQRLLNQYHAVHNEFETKKKKLKVEKKEISFKTLDTESRELKKLIKELRKDKDLQKAETILAKKKEEKQEIAKEIEKIEDQMHRAIKVSYTQLIVGDWIKLKKSGLLGKILAKNKKKYNLLVGDMNMQVNERDIVPSRYEPIKTNKKKPVTTNLAINVNEIESELDIRGYRKSEAEGFITEFLDHAFLGSADVLTVIHGVGGGVLKKTLIQKLKEYKGIKRYWSPEEEFGGDGVTMIQI